MPDQNLDDVLTAMVTQNPSGVLEACYWAQEEGLLEFIRDFLCMPVETQAALKALARHSRGPGTERALRDDRSRPARERNAKMMNFATGACELDTSVVAGSAQKCGLNR